FYDLNRSPITCPVCQAVYQVSPPTSRRGERATTVAPKPEEVEADPPVVKDVEVISLEEAEEAEDAAIDDEEIVDIEDGDAEIPAADDDDNTFLEQEEEGEADVSGIVGGGSKEES
ncbi:MAG: TIGR02300 family protein, partial [Methyloceanibacter sp.]